MAVANIKKRYFDRVIDKILENILGYWFVWFIDAQGYVAPAGLIIDDWLSSHGKNGWHGGPPFALYQQEKQKTKSTPCDWCKCLLWAIDGVAVWNSLSELRYFQPAAPSPSLVLHHPQGDKQK